MTPLALAINNYVWLLRSLQHYKKGDARITRSAEEMTTTEQRIAFYRNLGASTTALDREGRDYKSFLQHHYQQPFLEDQKVLAKVKVLLFPNRTKSRKWKWKFW